MANKVYTVKSGDNLSAIAKKHGTTVAALLRANPAIAKRREAGRVDIFSGTKIKLPGTGGKGGSSAGTARSANAARESAMAGRAAQTAARGARARTERNRDAAAASRGQGKNTRSVSQMQQAATARKWYGSAEHRAAQRQGLKSAAALATTVMGGVGAARGVAAGIARGTSAVRNTAALRAVKQQADAVAKVEARLQKAVAARKAGNPVGTPRETAALRQELKMEKARLARMQGRTGSGK